MAKPNSLTTLLRRWLADEIKPYPDEGETWCQDCVMNDGNTLVLDSSVALAHLSAHRKNPGDRVSMVGSIYKGEK